MYSFVVPEGWGTDLPGGSDYTPPKETPDRRMRLLAG